MPLFSQGYAAPGLDKMQARLDAASMPAQLSIVESQIVGNTAYLDGGAVALRFESAASVSDRFTNDPRMKLRVTLWGSTFERNSASGGGGALSLVSSAFGAFDTLVSVQNCTFVANSAGERSLGTGTTALSGLGGAIMLLSQVKIASSIGSSPQTASIPCRSG